MGRYLYNGVELPALPELDKEQYPYAFITHTNLAVVDYNYTLHVYSAYRFATNDKGNWVIINVGAAKSCSTGASTNYDAWGAFTDKEDGGLAPAVESTVVWSNFDVLNEDGTLYLAASDPIPVSNPPAPNPFWMTMGWLVGRMIAGMRGKREPVAYLYNGVRLPKLPEWDKETYPYAYLEYADKASTLYCVKSTATVGDGYLWFPNDTEGIRCVLLLEKWGGYSDYSPSSINADRIIWANVDVLNYADGSVWLAASDPVPVYE